MKRTHIHRIFRIAISCIIFFLFVLTCAQQTHAVIAPAEQGEDYTVFRTVNSLSCHPQNPYVEEVPHFVLFDPDSLPSDYQPRTLESTGYCATIHAEARPEHIGVAGGTAPRPIIPRRHYIVYEVPNPFYKAANEAACASGGASLVGKDKFCGKWLHFEGFIQVSNVAHASSTHEAWHLENYIGAFSTGNAGAKFEMTKGTYPYVENGVTTNIPVARFNNFAGTFQLHKNGNQATVRPNAAGDPSDSEYKNLGALKMIMSYKPAEGANFANPTFFTDIPHDRFGVPTQRMNISWLKCKESYPSGYFGSNFSLLSQFDPAVAQVKAVTPSGCDYESLVSKQYDVTKMPVCLGPSYTSGVTIPGSLDGCLVNTTPTPQVTATYTVTLGTKTQAHPQFGVGSTLGYSIDGVEGKELTLIRGQVYQFSVGSIQSAHPFYLSTSPVGLGQGTTIVPPSAVVGGIMTFTPTSNTPATIYYSCNVHGNMGWKINIVDSETPTNTPTSTLTPTTTPNPYDISGDTVVTVVDYNLLLTRFGQAVSPQEGNYNNNQKVDIFDYNSLITNF